MSPNYHVVPEKKEVLPKAMEFPLPVIQRESSRAMVQNKGYLPVKAIVFCYNARLPSSSLSSIPSFLCNLVPVPLPQMEHGKSVPLELSLSPS